MTSYTMGDRIKEMRKKLGLTQEALGKKAGVTKSTISKWETGEYVPAAFNIVELSKQLGVTSEWILRGQGAGTPKYRADHRGKFIARPIVNIPVIKLAQAHRAEELIGPDSRESEESKRMESITLPANLCPKDSYAIQLEHSIGKFDKGSYLIFSPTKSPSPGDVVICTVRGENEVRTFRRVTGDSYQLISLDPNAGYDQFDDTYRSNILSVACLKASFEEI